MKYGSPYGYGEQHKYELLEIVGLKEPSGVNESEMEVILDLMPEDAKFVCGLPKATRYDIESTMGTPGNPFPDFPCQDSMERESERKKVEQFHRKVTNIFLIINFHSWELNFLY